MNQIKTKIEIQVAGRIPKGFTESSIKKMIIQILDLAKLSAESIGVAFVAVDKITKLNKQYRKINKPTDVLSFAYHETKNPRRNMEGDIIICAKYVKDDIIKANIDFTTQIKRLLVHGVLHLAGFDHMHDNQEKKMFALQEKILKKL
jgi:probable rRNA maturation factor